MFTTVLENLPRLLGKQPTREHGLEGRDAYPISVSPQTPIAQEFKRFLNTGQREILDRTLSKFKIQFDKPLIIDVMDLSTSIGHGAVPRFIIENQAAQLHQIAQWANKEDRQAQLWQFGISSEVHLLHPETAGPVDLRSLKVFNPHELTDAADDTQGGLLHSGSRLSDALYFSAELGRAYRRVGFEQKIGIAVITDGWNRNSDPKLTANNEPGMRDRDRAFGHGQWIAHSEAHALHAIEAARAERIQFRLLGFVERFGMEKFEAFVGGVGLTPGEVSVTRCNARDQHDASAAITKVFCDRGKFLEDCSKI